MTMISKMKCPRCGAVSANSVHGVCRACFMREHHRKRSASGGAECPRCGAISANFVHGVCRACFMRDYHQRRLASVAADNQKAPETPTFVDGSESRRLCVECQEPGIYALGRCLSCYMRDRRRRNRMKLGTCTICGASFQSARRDALYCSEGCRQKAHRAGKARRASDIVHKAPSVAPV